MNKALLMIIDGCRSDALAVAHTPHINRLIEEGTHTLKARTVSPSITLPVHFSIFTSLKPSSHGITTNWTPPSTSVQALSITALAKYAGLTTAAFYGWEFLRDLTPPGCLDMAVHCRPQSLGQGDRRIAETAADHILNHRPDFGFIYFGDLDEVGHQHGFMSKAYLNTLERADQAVGLILDVLDRLTPDENYHVILHSDHGGLGFSHDEDRTENLVVPYVAWGSSIMRGRRLETWVSVLDTAPTLARILNIKPHPMWQGRALSSMFR